MKFPDDLTMLSEADLKEWQDTFHALFMLGEAGNEEMFQYLRGLPDADRERFDEAVSAEIGRRMEAEALASAAKIEAEPDLSESEVGYQAQKFRQRICRILRLVDMNCPEVILAREMEILDHYRPIVPDVVRKTN